MTTAENDTQSGLLTEIRGTRDALTVRRIFGDPITAGGATIVPVGRISGGGGGGGGEGTGPGDAGGRGFGTGYALGVRPLGVYEMREGKLRWRPALDVERIIRGFQILAVFVTVCTALVALRRRPAGE